MAGLARTVGEADVAAPQRSGAYTTRQSGGKHRKSCSTKTAEAVGWIVADAGPKGRKKDATRGAMFTVEGIKRRKHRPYFVVIELCTK